MHLHDYQPIFETKWAIMEVCKRCKKRIWFRKGFDTRVEKRYLKEHKRDLLQPWDNLYYKEYPFKMQVQQKSYNYLRLGNAN